MRNYDFGFTIYEGEGELNRRERREQREGLIEGREGSEEGKEF